MSELITNNRARLAAAPPDEAWRVALDIVEVEEVSKVEPSCMYTCLREEDSTRFKRFLVGIRVMCGVTGSHMGRYGGSPPQYWRHHSTGAKLSSVGLWW